MISKRNSVLRRFCFGSSFSFNVHTIKLPLKLVLEFLTFLLFGYTYKTSASLFEILSPTLFERFYAEFSTIFHDFDIAISNWEVLAFCLILILTFITFEFFGGKTTDAAILLLLAVKSDIVFLYHVLIILFDHKT